LPGSTQPGPEDAIHARDYRPAASRISAIRMIPTRVTISLRSTFFLRGPDSLEETGLWLKTD